MTTIRTSKGMGKLSGTESAFTKKLRAKQLEAVIDTYCFICGVGVHRTARGGIEWFKKHEQSRKHKRNLRRRFEDAAA